MTDTPASTGDYAPTDPRGWVDAKLLRFSAAAHDLLGDPDYTGEWGPVVMAGIASRLDEIETEITRRVVANRETI